MKTRPVERSQIVQSGLITIAVSKHTRNRQQLIFRHMRMHGAGRQGAAGRRSAVQSPVTRAFCVLFGLVAFGDDGFMAQQTDPVENHGPGREVPVF